MEASMLNNIVASYLKSVSSKLADKFMKETKSSPLPPGSPGLKEMVDHYQESPKTEKRKLPMTNGAVKTKKAKKVLLLKIFVML